MTTVTEDELRCLFVQVQYTAINPTSLKRDGDGPTIETSYDSSGNVRDCSMMYRVPVVSRVETPEGGKRRYVVKVWDPNAVDESRGDLVGDCHSGGRTMRSSTIVTVPTRDRCPR